MQRHLHSVGIFVLVCVLAGSVPAQTFNSLAAFGGSLSDSGNLAPVPGTARRHQLYHRSRSGRTRDRRAGLWRIGPVDEVSLDEVGMDRTWCPGLKGGSLMAMGQQKDRQGDLW